MDFQNIITMVAPLIVIGLTALFKNLITSRFAPVVVFVLGGIAALVGIGPAPGGGFVDATINIAWVSGLATLIYDLVKKLSGK